MSSQDSLRKSRGTPLDTLQIPNAKKEAVAGIGSNVLARLVFHKNDTESLGFTLVGDRDADINQNRISVKVALGEAVLGRTAKDKSYYFTPDGDVVGVDINEVENPEP